MCTYSISVDDTILERVRPALPNNEAVEAWMQSQMDALLLQLAESLTHKPKAKIGEPQSLTTEEATSLTLQRGRDIKTGRTKLTAHEMVMQEMEQMLSTYAD